SSDMSSAKRYKTEPFALCGDVYGVGKNAGRGGWSHYTGAAGWLYNAGTEHMLGVKKVGDELFIKPNTAFDEFEFEYKFDGTIYKIKVVRDSAANESATVKLNKDNGVKNMVINIAY
ncbi:MAG: hypothetical protein IJO48_04985, partial [Clostridia bacterium]|nr:hypothetical protein [Clostridia bacterium]